MKSGQSTSQNDPFLILIATTFVFFLVIGVPYGDYRQVQYLPYAQNAYNQITGPLIFSPNLPSTYP